MHIDKGHSMPHHQRILEPPQILTMLGVVGIYLWCLPPNLYNRIRYACFKSLYKNSCNRHSKNDSWSNKVWHLFRDLVPSTTAINNSLKAVIFFSSAASAGSTTSSVSSTFAIVSLVMDVVFSLTS